MQQKENYKVHKQVFHSNFTKFHTFFTSSNNRTEIEEKTNRLIAITDHTKLELSAWLKLVKLTPEKIIADLISTIQNAIEGCQRAALYKTKAVIIEKLRSHPFDRPRHARHQKYHLHLVHLVALRKKL